MVINSKIESNVTLHGEKIEQVKKFKYLGWWLEENMNNNEHIKNRKLAMIIASNKLKKIGFNSKYLENDLKKFLSEVYCRSTLLSCIENTFMTQRDTKEIQTLESKIIKVAVGLNKYHSTSMLNNALQITPLEETIKMRKLQFVKNLLKHSVTRKIIEAHNENKQGNHPKSLTTEINKLTGHHYGHSSRSTEEIIEGIEKKLTDITQNVQKNQNTNSAIAIRYLLTNNTKQNQDLANKLMRWDNKKEIKSR